LISVTMAVLFSASVSSQCEITISCEQRQLVPNA
jgi:hypothetical protein